MGVCALFTIHIGLSRLHLCVNFCNNRFSTFRVIVYHRLGDIQSVIKTILRVYLVIDKLCDVASDTKPLYQILEQSDKYFWSYCISKIWDTKCHHKHPFECLTSHFGCSF